MRQPYGAVLVTGPTGSGKSTTLYAALAGDQLGREEHHHDRGPGRVPDRRASTRSASTARPGLTFAAGLRSILRADPDVIMVGEIRDAETARIAIEAALTGHMVLSTLHTNDAPGAIVRLAKMGIEPFLTASAVDCVVAQRLARKLCPHCKRRTVVPQGALNEAGFRVGADLEAYEPVGCARCNRSGYKGRIGLFSVMAMSERIKDLDRHRRRRGGDREVAREEGMLTLREDGLAKVRAGITSVAEVARVST